MSLLTAAALLCAGVVAGIFFRLGRPKGLPRGMYMFLAGLGFVVALFGGSYLLLILLLAP